MLTRLQFEETCKAFIAKYSTIKSPPFQGVDALKDWKWNEYPSGGMGFMSRQILYLNWQHQEMTLDSESYANAAIIENDEATAPTDMLPKHLVSQQYVAYSPSFQVPALYFTLHDSNGSPLTLDEIVRSPLLKATLAENAETTSYALSQPSASFPLLSQAEHPVLGSPCWCLHPCQTGAAIDEIMAAIAMNDWSELEIGVRWIETWFMIAGTAVNWNSS